MGFGAAIGHIARERIGMVITSPEMFAANFDKIYKDCKIDWDKDYIDDWCSDGMYWFDQLRGMLPNYDNECGGGFYVVTKENYPELVNFALSLMDDIAGKEYRIVESFKYLENDEEGSYVCRPIDGIIACDDSGLECKFYKAEYDECSFRTVDHTVDSWNYNSVFRFIKAVMRIGALDLDKEIVWISGGC